MVDVSIAQGKRGGGEEGRPESGIRYHYNARAAAKHHFLGHLRGHLSRRRHAAP
jgi:hypothetical protein